MRGRRRRRRKQLQDDFKEMRGYCKLKHEALDRTLWRTSFGRDCAAVVRQTTEWYERVPKFRIIMLPLSSRYYKKNVRRLLDTLFFKVYKLWLFAY